MVTYKFHCHSTKVPKVFQFQGHWDVLTQRMAFVQELTSIALVKGAGQKEDDVVNHVSIPVRMLHTKISAENLRNYEKMPG